MKEQLRGRMFSNEEELVSALDSAIDGISGDVWPNAFEEWFKRFKKCIECQGEHFEKSS